MQCAARIPEAGAVLELLERCPEHQRKGSFPVVVFEGLDATGKGSAWLESRRRDAVAPESNREWV